MNNDKVTVSVEELFDIGRYIELEARRYSADAMENYGKIGKKGYCWMMIAISDALRRVSSKINLRVQALDTIQSLIDNGMDKDEAVKYVYSRGAPSFVNGKWGEKKNGE